MVNKKYKVHTADICQTNAILPLSGLLRHQMATMAFKYFQDELFVPSKSPRLEEVRIVQVTPNKGGHLFSSKLASYWNALPLQTRHIEDPKFFKANYKQIIIEALEYPICNNSKCPVVVKSVVGDCLGSSSSKSRKQTMSVYFRGSSPRQAQLWRRLPF